MKHVIERADQVVHQLMLEDVSSCASSKGLGDIVLGVDQGEEDDRCSRSSLLEGVHGFKPIEPWHVDVEHDDVWRESGCRLERLATIGEETCHLEVVGEQ